MLSKIDRKLTKLKNWLFSKSQYKSTGSHARVLKTCTHHIFEKRNSKTLRGGTSGQTGNSCFFDFWGEYLVNFGGKSKFFPWPKVVHYQCSTKSLIISYHEKWPLPPLLGFLHIPEVKSHRFPRSEVTQKYLKKFVLAGSPTLVINGVPLSGFVSELYGS